MKAWEIMEQKELCKSGAYAETREGTEVNTRHRMTRLSPAEIISCCTYGAISMAYPKGGYQEWKVLERKIMERIIGSIPSWNDRKTTSKADVVNLLKELDI